MRLEMPAAVSDLADDLANALTGEGWAVFHHFAAGG